MAKLPAKKAAPKKAPAKKATTKKATVKKAAPKKAAAKKIVKIPLTEKQEEQKEANRIANLENKKSTVKTVKRPKKVATKEQTMDLLDAIVEGMKEKKGKNITIINLIGLEHRVADYFVICDADSNTHVKAIADTLEETVIKYSKEKPFHSEGYQNSEWILIDYVNIVAHVFLNETRQFYNIEGLWADGEFTQIED